MRALVLAALVLAVPGCKADPAGSSGAPAPASSATARGISGQILHLEGDRILATDPVPASALGHGEALRAIWTAADGTTFVAGYQYAGGPSRSGAPAPNPRGHDTGAVYRRAPGGGVQLVYSKAETELGRVWGRSAGDVYVGGQQTLAHFDGKAWTEIAIPQIEGSISGIWGDGTDLWVSAGHQFNAFIYHQDPKGAWSVEARTEVMLFNLGGVGSSVWAVGSSGAILHREKDGRWTQEVSEKTKQYSSVWASAPDDVYAAGTDLVHSRGDGLWTKVALPAGGPLRYVWGRGKDDVFAGVPTGVLHLTGGAWARTGVAVDSAGIAGAGGALFVAHNDLH